MVTAPARFETNHVGADTESTLADLEARVRKMRDLGVTRWGDIELGPAPTSDVESDDNMAQQPTAAQLEQRAREERRRVALASSGGPLRRLADD